MFCEIRQERNSAVRGVAERAAKEKAVCFYTRLFYEATPFVTKKETPPIFLSTMSPDFSPLAFIIVSHFLHVVNENFPFSLLAFSPLGERRGGKSGIFYLYEKLYFFSLKRMYKHGDRHAVAALLLLTLAAMKEPATVLSSLERQRKGTSRRELRAERDSATPCASGGEKEK